MGRALKRRYGRHGGSYGLDGPGTRPIDELVRHHAAATVPAPRLTMREQVEYDRQMRELLERDKR